MATDRLSTIFAALADPTRRAILARLASGDATVTELAEPFDISLPAISRHLKVLESAGLISRGRSAQWRTSSLEGAPLKEITDWMEPYRRFWDANFTRLDAHLKRLQEQMRLDDADSSDSADTSDNLEAIRKDTP
jgi:DNA-binding transcriptional ArsR family regulator